MYNIPHFKAADENEVRAFMQAHPFVTLCGCDKQGQPVATHIPVLIEERHGRLFLGGHVMRKQQHTLAFEQNPGVLVIFSGANAYISASWYQSKAVASTWNYQAVHARGMLHWKDDAFLYNLLTKLTAHFEADPQSPSLVPHMGETYMRDMMKAIAGFEVEVHNIEHVFKLSQNHPEHNYGNIITHLQQGDASQQAVAAAMQANHDNVFPVSTVNKK